MRMAVFIPLNGTFPKALCVERNCSTSEISSNPMRIPRLFSMRSSPIRTPWGGVVTLRNKPGQEFHLTQVEARLEEASLRNIAVLPETSENVWCDSKRVSRISWKSPRCSQYFVVCQTIAKPDAEAFDLQTSGEVDLDSTTQWNRRHCFGQIEFGVSFNRQPTDL